MKRIIIQCSGRKNGGPWTVGRLGGINAKFVSHPDSCRVTPGIKLFKPDDKIPDSSKSWREFLINYNKHADNPDHLLKAGSLYQDKTYGLLISKFGWENTYILSAGWGLVRSDYYLPLYDITFSKKVDDCYRRKKTDKFNDFNHLSPEENGIVDDGIFIFVTSDYLDLLYELTKNIPVKKYIFYISEKTRRLSGYEYIKYHTNQRTNWQYSCAQDFASGKIDP
jgi:hypothetical protein